MIPSDIRRELQFLVEGRSEVVGSVNLAASPATSTSVTRLVCSDDSYVFLTPINSSAAGENPYITAANGSFVITHASSANTRTYGYVILTGRD